MTRFQGFETKEGAKKFIKEQGYGLLTTRILTPSGRKPRTWNDYHLAVWFGGLDEKKYPYCVQWNERRGDQ